MSLLISKQGPFAFKADPKRREMIASADMRDTAIQPVWSIMVNAQARKTQNMPAEGLQRVRTWVVFNGITREFTPGRHFSVAAQHVEVFAQVWPYAEGHRIDDPVDPVGGPYSPVPLLNPNFPTPAGYFWEGFGDVSIATGAIADGATGSRWIHQSLDGGADPAHKTFLNFHGDNIGRDSAEQLNPSPVTLLTMVGFNAGASTRWLYVYDYPSSPQSAAFVLPVKGGEGFSLSLGPTGRVFRSGGISWVASSTADTCTQDITALFRVDCEVVSF